MLTADDAKTIEKVMRSVVNEVVSDIVDEKLETKLKPLYDFKDEAMRILEAILNDLQEKHEFERNVDKRVIKLEQIHPDYQHTSVL